MLMRQRNILHFKNIQQEQAPGLFMPEPDAPARDYRVLFISGTFFGIKFCLPQTLVADADAEMNICHFHSRYSPLLLCALAQR